jgi:hypothetical protein
MRLTNFVILTVAVLVLYVVLIQYSSKKERFSTDDKIEWELFNTRLQRAIYFRAPHSNVSASERAIVDTNQFYDSVPKGKCASLNTSSRINSTSHSIVEEFSLLYSLNALCLALKFEKKSKNEIYFKIKDSNDWYAYAYLRLLNPLYLEFNANNAPMSSIGYYIKNDNNFVMNSYGMGHYQSESDRTMTGYKNVTLNLLPIQSQNEQVSSVALANPDSDSIESQRLFTYENYGGRTLAKLTFDKNASTVEDTSKYLNIRAYYLDDVPVSSQNVATYLKYTRAIDGKYKVYDKNYLQIKDVKTLQDKFKSISATDIVSVQNVCRFVMKYYGSLERNEYPVFTVTFDLNINDSVISSVKPAPNTNNVIFELFMNNKLGVQKNCQNNYGTLGTFNMNGNILSAALKYSANMKETTLRFCTSRNDSCLFSNPQDVLDIKLPIFEDSSLGTVIVTVTPYAIMVLVSWTSKGNGLQWVFGQKNIQKGNDFEKLFVGPVNQNNALDDILINSSLNFVPQVSKIQLGYVNFAKYIKNNIYI